MFFIDPDSSVAAGTNIQINPVPVLVIWQGWTFAKKKETERGDGPKISQTKNIIFR